MVRMPQALIYYYAWQGAYDALAGACLVPHDVNSPIIWLEWQVPIVGLLAGSQCQ